MGFLKKLLGGEKDKEPPRPSRKTMPPEPAAPREAAAAPDLEALPPRKLVRLLGATDKPTRHGAAARLAELGQRTAVRPLMNAYLNYGETPFLEALRSFGSDVSAPIQREAQDLGVVGERRARMMDILGVTGDENAAVVVRGFVDRERNEPLVHVRACVALARLGDMRGIDELAHDLELTDSDLRRMALAALQQLDIAHARQAITDHIDRYLGGAGAIPEAIEISAPRLEDPDRSLSSFVVEHVKRKPHALTVIVASGAIKMASTRQSDIRRGLEGYDVHFTTERLAPEEQIAVLEEARDAAAVNPDACIVVMGKLPNPNGSVPLPHFLQQVGGEGYTAKILAVDPHHVAILMDWWHYVEDRAEVSTEFEVILAISRPKESAISEEEYMIYQLMPEDRRRDFLRAFLANV